MENELKVKLVVTVKQAGNNKLTSLIWEEALGGIYI